MKNYRLITLLLFSAFLLPGFWAGRQIGNESQTKQAVNTGRFSETYVNLVDTANQTDRSSLTAPLPPSPSPPVHSSEIPGRPSSGDESIIHQRNILVIGVDNLDTASPNLESVWLIIYMPNTPHFMLLPIYPTKSLTNTSSSTAGENLSDIFQLDSKTSPDAIFLEKLQASDIWWNSYILMDESALVEVANFVSSYNDRKNLDGLSAINSIPDPWDDPTAALIGQAEFAQDLCRQTVHLSMVDAWRYMHLFKAIQDHVRTDLDLEQTIAEWQQLMVYSGTISCEFPSLGTLNFHP